MNQSNSKRQFSSLFLALVIFLMTLPLFAVSQDLITKFLNLSGLSGLIQSFIIPIEIKFVVATLSLLGISAAGDGKLVVLQQGSIETFRAQIIWSCIGWQSVVLLIATLITGFTGKYTLISKFEAIVIGLIGTFWINIIRIDIIYILGFYFGKLTAFFFHSFMGTLFVVLWLFLFWWFSYRYVLEEKVL